MRSLTGGFLLSLLLFTGTYVHMYISAVLNCSLISLGNLVASLLVLFVYLEREFHSRGRTLLWSIVIFSLVVILSQVTFLFAWAIWCGRRSLEEPLWAKFIGFMIVQTWKSPTVIYVLILQLLAAFTAFTELHEIRLGLFTCAESFLGTLAAAIVQIGSYVKVVLFLLLPAVQLVVGISNTSWISLPFFVSSCVGLVDWSLTSNFHGLFRWWRPLWLYAGFNIFFLYVYQLPTSLPKLFSAIGDFIGLYRISSASGWTQICSGLSLIIFFFGLSFVKPDLEDMDLVMSMREGILTEHLLPSTNSFFIRESRTGKRDTNFLLRGAVFRTFSINFFTYGAPVSLFALSLWSFYFASVCALGLLTYVGYIIFAFPSLFHLHRLNGILLVFILLWAVSTYAFNIAFSHLNGILGKDTEVWEMVGLWHYPFPGFFILAQFSLGILVALVNLVNNSVFLYISDEVPHTSNGDPAPKAKKETKVLIVATIAWVLRKCNRALMLVQIFLIAMKPGFIHAVYMIFFFLYLLSHRINTRVQGALLLLCEIHFAILYTLQINMVCVALTKKETISWEILSQLGLLERDSSWDFVEIALLACFCAIQKHGHKLLFSFSAIVQHTPCAPVGFSILKAGLNKSVLLSVYEWDNTTDNNDNPSQERKVASYLSAIGQKFLSIYRSLGTYIAFITILITVYMTRPNYVSFGYLFLLLFWITGRQLAETSRKRLWFPLKAYSIVMFILIYILCIFRTFEGWISTKVDLYTYLGYNSKSTVFQNVSESLAITIAMQLYSYERRQNRYPNLEDTNRMQFGVIGFIRRLLIWHSQKILFFAMFYASISPISFFGLLYLLGTVFFSILPKASRVPSKSFIAYSGFVATLEYLFQLCGRQLEMFPGQKHHNLSSYLGLKVYEPGAWGLEAGLRAKVLVIAACTLQYNVFHWLEKMPSWLSGVGQWEEPCALFFSQEDVLPVVTPNGDNILSPVKKFGLKSSNSWPANNQELEGQQVEVAKTSNRRYMLGYFWGQVNENHKWKKKQVQSLRKERFEMQKTSLKIYLKFWMENMFILFGLEITMIVLLLASFALLNAISLLYIASLAVCVVLNRQLVKRSWLLFVVLFATVLLLEYFAIWKTEENLSGLTPSDATLHCHDCWRISELHFNFCRSCWLGLTVDDSRVLISYFVVFMCSCFKFRADRFCSFSGSYTYRQMISRRKNSFVWRDLSLETKTIWTLLDYLRLYCYCHLLDLVLALILITGTLEYDILHLGYLAFALCLFRLRLTILKKKNKIFKWLRIYNFVVIVLSLAYQSPFVGAFNDGKCQTIDYVYEVIGFYKYDYGFRITSRSALVEIIIFILVSLQSYMFSSPELNYVFQYLEAEQIGAIVREQEKIAAWKTEQLQHIREDEEKKRQRNMQVEKMKSEMLNLQIQLHTCSVHGHAHAHDHDDAYACTLAQAHAHAHAHAHAQGCDVSPRGEGLRRRRAISVNTESAIHKEDVFQKQESEINMDLVLPYEFHGTESLRAFESRENSNLLEVTEFEGKRHMKESTLISAVQLIGDGVSQVQSIGNRAVSNIANYLNIPQDLDLDSDSDLDEPTSFTAADKHSETESPNESQIHMGSYRSSSIQSERSRTSSDSASCGIIFQHIWNQMQSNNDVVCYLCFILVFLWNFSLLSMVYLAALFLYALCVNTGPNYIFWVLMLIYTEFYILIQYVYQIIIQHCGITIESVSLPEWGFPTQRITSSFVVSLLPLFLVYLFTLIQSSITAKDSEWIFATEFTTLRSKVFNTTENLMSSSWRETTQQMLHLATKITKLIIGNCVRYWNSLTQEAESPPYFIQLSLDVPSWPEYGIQPVRIESGVNELLRFVHNSRCNESDPDACPCASSVQVRSIEKSKDSPNVAVAVVEVTYASIKEECILTERYKSLTPAADVAKEITEAQDLGYSDKIDFPYSITSVIGGGKREIDLYAYIFGADLAVFFLVAIFYQSVIKNKNDFLDVYQLEDQFPKEFVFILMAIFFLIVLDRVIYLCSFAIGKVIFFIFNLVIFTYFVTEYAWSLDPSQHNAAGLALRAIYVTKAISLALQAIQIKSGVPHKSSLYRQFLTSSITRVNYLGYRLYRALPFLYELRCVLDWSCTTTSLTMYDWLKLEDINASLYLVKSDALLNRAGHRQGQKQRKVIKFCNGLCLFFILICVIWAPMLMYSSGNPTNIANPINDASVQFHIKTNGGRLLLYETTLCAITPWNVLKSYTNLDPNDYLDSYNVDDIQMICCHADAVSRWIIPDAIQTTFIQSLDVEMDMKFSWVLTRDRPKNKEVVKYEQNIQRSDLPDPSELKQVLNGSSDSFRTNNTYPRYFRVTGSGDVRLFDQKEGGVDAKLLLNRENNSEWWSFYDISWLDSKVCGDLMGPRAIVVSEETPQGLLGETLSKSSIWGLYITFVLAVGRFIRLQCSDLRMRIPFENLPSCDRLIAICEDIYAARAEGELVVEEVLYWTLVKIYRSPHMLLEYTNAD
ncbi:putative Piezo family protein [Helianthus annuus]|uniref:Piezo family protein n=1 Tax=Helianthus annuus TaxID=4232 RepID=A0A9K3H0S8_HELAN|nr:putative Piezo family protein [Helianthus annuus]KAJ0449894.1 putative Piezo family protein [Helianthus annuus]KAJ0647255.1 putative Piezo family protein [Helianthus annuus]KAJ0829724.1 putative Piezo family protein [Helianthus annuus]